MDPIAEIKIDESLVTELVFKQFPELSHLELKFVDEGWDNVNYKLGSEYLVRLPRRQLGADLIKNEIKYLKEIAPKLSLPIPSPLFIGKPESFYKWDWTVLPWFEGESADIEKPNKDQALRLAEFLKNLHHQKIIGPKSANRGVSLLEKQEALIPRMERLKNKTNYFNSHIQTLWNQSLKIDSNHHSNLLHGDLHARNIVVKDGIIQAIIDWGDICSGDPATDLASFWMLFPDKKIREEALEFYGVDRDLKSKSIGWAIYFATVLLDTGMESNARHAKMGELTFQNLMSEK